MLRSLFPSSPSGNRLPAPTHFDRNENILMYFRVSTVQCPKVIYVIQLLLFRVCNRTRNAEVPQKFVLRTV